MSFDSFSQTHFSATENLSVREAVARAGLDWTAEKEPVYRRSADGSFQPIDSHRIVTRGEQGAMLGMVGRDYVPVQISEAFYQVQPLIDSGEARIVSAGHLGGGKKVFIQAELSDGAVDVTPGDTVHQYVVFANGHDGSLAVSSGYTAIRIVCQNTMMAAARSTAFKARHTRNVMLALERYREEFAAQRAALKEQGERWRSLSKRKLSDRNLERYIREALQPGAGNDPSKTVKGVDRIVELAHTAPGAQPGTLWGGVNALTYWASHERGRSENSRRESLMFGTGGQLVERALDVAYQYAEKLPLAEAGYAAAQNFATAKADFDALLGRPARIPSLES